MGSGAVCRTRSRSGDLGEELRISYVDSPGWIMEWNVFDQTSQGI